MKIFKKKTIVITVILLAVTGSAWLLFFRDGDNAGPDEYPEINQQYTVEKGFLSVQVETAGRVVPQEEVEIKCKASGEVIKLPVDVSDIVKKGDLLVQIDPENEQRSVQRANITLAVTEAKYMQAKLNLQIAENNLKTETIRAKAELLSAEAKVNESRAKHERLKQLLDKKMASKEEVDTAHAAYYQALYNHESARARLKDLETEKVSIESKRQDLEIAEAQVKSDKLLLSDAEERLEDTTVIAPIDGVVAVRNIQVGTIIASGINNVGGGTTMMTLIDMSRIFVLAYVDESDIGRIKPGQRARITVDAYPEMTFPGEVVRVATKGVEESSVVTFEVKIEVKGRNRQFLKPEMTADVEVIAVEKDDVLLVPVTAIERRRGETFVSLYNSETTVVRQVTIGDSDGEFMEIVAGLNEGDVVSAGSGSMSSRWQMSRDDARNMRRRERMQMRMMRGGSRR
jgi:RND family efflux transporter MFP subunit